MIDFDSAGLERYLQARLPDGRGPWHLERLRGGQSNPTYRLTSDSAAYVLRKQPAGVLLPSAHAIDREYWVLSALASTGVPVPRTYLYCDDRAIIGTPFYLMQALDGRVFVDSSLLGLGPTERAGLYDAMNATLAGLHQVDWRALGLADFGKPGSYFRRQIARWTRQWQASRLQPIPEIDRLSEWLPAHVPDGDDETVIAHGDYRLANLIFDPVEPRVIGVVDWELCTLGHPLADLAYNCLLYHATPEEFGGVLGLDTTALGIPNEADYVASYCERTGRADGITAFHLAFALFRFAIILAGISARAAQGNAAGSDAEAVGALSVNYAQRGWGMVKG